MTVAPEAVKQVEKVEEKEISTAIESPQTTKDSLNQAELAKRLQVNESTMSRNKEKPDFYEWSKGKDPESIPWSFCKQTKRFVKAE